LTSLFYARLRELLFELGVELLFGKLKFAIRNGYALIVQLLIQRPIGISQGSLGRRGARQDTILPNLSHIIIDEVFIQHLGSLLAGLGPQLRGQAFEGAIQRSNCSFLGNLVGLDFRRTSRLKPFGERVHLVHDRRGSARAGAGQSGFDKCHKLVTIYELYGIPR